MSIEGQGHFFTIYFPGFVCFVLYKARISGLESDQKLLSLFGMLNGTAFLAHLSRRLTR